MNSKIEEAISFATEAHKGQVDKVGKPYIFHLLRVMMEVDKLYGDEDLTCAAVLHDILEDTDITYFQIYEKFGERVAYIVSVLTKSEVHTYEEYIDEICKSQDVMKIKKVDLRDNYRRCKADKNLRFTSLASRYEKALIKVAENLEQPMVL